MHDDQTDQGLPVLRTITNIGRFQPKTFIPKPRPKSVVEDNTDQIAYTPEGIRTFRLKNAKLERVVHNIESDIAFLQASIDRQEQYMNQVLEENKVQVESIKQQIQNRKAQLAKINNSQEPPTTNQIFALVRQIQVEGMAAKRRAENSIKSQDVNMVLSGDRIKRFHEFLGPKVQDTILRDNPKLRKAYDRMEEGVYKTAEIQTQLRSLKIYSTNLEKKLIELNSKLESLQFDKSDIQMGIVDKKEELNAELSKRSEEIGKLRWRIAYMKAMKAEINQPMFDVRLT